MADKVKYRTDSQGVKVKVTFDEENKVWRSSSPEFDQKPLRNRRGSTATPKESSILQPRQTPLPPARKGSGAELRGGGRAFNRGGKV